MFQAETEISLLKQEKSRLQIEVCYASTCCTFVLVQNAFDIKARDGKWVVLLKPASRNVPCWSIMK
jgi:hypothetical protein